MNMGEYKYPICFDVPSLNDKLKQRIVKYFQIRRKSGGGECGPLECVGGITYKISFKDEDDQLRVLQRQSHILETENAPIQLSVRQWPDIRSDTLRSPATKDSGQAVSLVWTPGTLSQYEKTIELDMYLLRFLRDTPEARSYLQLQLSPISCSFQLYPDAGKMVVKPTVEIQQTSNLEARINEVFDHIQSKYSCHYEADQFKLQALQDSPFLAMGDVQVYRETGEGFLVLVGEAEKVKQRLLMLEKLQGHTGSVAREWTCTECCLGEGRLKLLGGDLERDLKKDFPDLRVSQTEMGRLLIEGMAHDVGMARKRVKKKAAEVEERLVSRISHDLLVFLRSLGPEALASILGQVSVLAELDYTGLHLLSLSGEALDKAESALLTHIIEEEVLVQELPTHLPKVKEVLQTEALHQNQGKPRIQVNYRQHSIQLLGFCEAVKRLKEVIFEFLKDQAVFQVLLNLPYEDLSDQVCDLMTLLNLDHEGVQVTLAPSRLPPMVLLTGPRHLVVPLKARVSTAFDSLVQETVTIDLPGALGYFNGAGQEYLQAVGRTHQCFIRIQGSGDPQEPGYRLEGGLRVCVRVGDITQERADALVNAANENLEHLGGVAEVLSQAGGPDVQRESQKLVQQMGRVATGTAVATTPGNLPCKVLVHAVGPMWHRGMGHEKPVKDLLEKAVTGALELAEGRGCRSLAMPCISSGIFGVPLDLCASAIVSAVRMFGRSPRTLQTVTLVDSNTAAVRAMQTACDTLLGRREPPAGDSMQGMHGNMPHSIAPATMGVAAFESFVQVKVLVENIEDLQVDALISPMLGHDPKSSRVGSCLLNSPGSNLRAKFEQAAQGRRTAPGEVLLVADEEQHARRCVIFLHCLRWDHAAQGPAVQALRQGLKEVLKACDTWAFASVAIPMIGTGISLGFPYHTAARILLEEIQLHERTRMATNTLHVLIAIHSNDKNSAAALQASQVVVNLRSFQMPTLPVQKCFYHCISLTQDEMTVMMGGVRLQVSFGDIIKEGTDVIVNSTNFTSIQSGLSAALLSAAGHGVKAEFDKARAQAEKFFTTQPGSLACKAIMHIFASKDPRLIRSLCGDILKYCEQHGYRSVAFPAVCAGAAGIAAKEVASLMLDGMASVVRDSSFINVSLIRIVLLLRPVFEVFRCEVEKRLGNHAPQKNIKEKSMDLLKNMKREKGRKQLKNPTHPDSSSPSVSNAMGLASWRPLPVVLSVTGPGREAVRKVHGDLEAILQRQLLERELEARRLGLLTQAELASLMQKVQLLELSVQRVGRTEDPEAGRYAVKGLKEKVLEFCEVTQQMQRDALYRKVEEREEVITGFTVQWSICMSDGIWQCLGLQANYVLEQEHQLGGTSPDKTIDGPGGLILKVDIKKQQATDQNTGLIYKLKRMEISADFNPPLCWDPMEGVGFKKVPLQPGSTEYRTVADDFQRTARNRTIQKIERVQNVHLWRAYQGKMQHFEDKNGQGQVGEKFLYHGTSGVACASIEREGFNRSYAGQNGTAYGMGVYFAVDASYSTNPSFSAPDGKGLRYMFVARVLTGIYTLGNSTIRVLPIRPGSVPSTHFDSLVDRTERPSMFVIFHDDQAYPEYIITFT